LGGKEKSRRAKWIVIPAVAFLVLLFNLIIFGILFLPAIIRSYAVETLEGLGVPDVDMKVTALTPGSIRIEDLLSGDGGRFRVKAIEAEFSPGSLASKRVDDVRVSEVRVGLVMKDGALDLGPLAGLMGGESSAVVLPFRTLELKDAVVALDTGGKPVEVSLNADLKQGGDGKRPIAVAGRGTLPGGGTFELEGGLALGEEGVSGEMKAVIPRFTIREEDGDLPGRCVPAAKGYRVGGDVALAATVSIENGRVDPNIRIELAGVSLENEESKTDAEGIEVSTVVNGISPFTTEAGRRLSVEKASFGEFTTENVRAFFHVADYPRVEVESLSCDWADGKLTADHASVDLDSYRFDAVLRAEGLSVQKVIDFFQPGAVECEGKLWGTLPVSVHLGEKRRLTFGKGFLEARPKRGWIKIREKDVKWMLGIEEVVPLEQAKPDEAVKLLLLQALQDLEYTQFRFDFGEEKGKGWAVHGMISGSGPRGEENRIPVAQFQKNIYGLDDLLNLIVNGMRLMPAAAPEEEEDEEQKAVDDALEAFF
jgi:hypothetical protein